MSAPELAVARIRAGRWEAELVAPDQEAAPAVEVWHLERRLEGVTVVDAGTTGRWSISVQIPVELLSDGVQTFLVRDGGTGEKLGQFTIVTGVPLEDDIRAEVDLLRAELDMLKKAFRRHCLETSGS